jgi:hypothetical protein
MLSLSQATLCFTLNFLKKEAGGGKMSVRFHNLSSYKAFVVSFLARRLSETTDEKTKALLNELIQRTDLLRTRDFYRFLKRILEVQEQTGVDLNTIIPTEEEIQQIFQYPA